MEPYSITRGKAHSTRGRVLIGGQDISEVELDSLWCRISALHGCPGLVSARPPRSGRLACPARTHRFYPRITRRRWHYRPRRAGPGFVGGDRDAAGWTSRAKGWIRVVQTDVWVTLVILTCATLSFYFLGAGVLHRLNEKSSISPEMALRFEKIGCTPTWSGAACAAAGCATRWIDVTTYVTI